jgi:hypothetical protein
LAEYNCEICGKPLEYSGRGRPPKRCDTHKTTKLPAEGESKVPQAPRPRPKPGVFAPPVEKPEAEAQEKPQASPSVPPAATPDVQSRAKAESAAKRARDNTDAAELSWPTNASGKPLAKITMTASELIPTGQYANVSVGPAQITAFVDLDRTSEKYFSDQENETLTKAMNELAEIVERDVIAVQRNIVLESIQEQLTQNGN